MHLNNGPNKELHYVSNNIVISAISNKVLSTDFICKYYRSLLKANKELPFTATSYKKNENEALKLAVGSIGNNLNFNSLNVNPFYYYDNIEIEIELLNIVEHNFLSFVDKDYYVFITEDTVERKTIYHTSEEYGESYTSSIGDIPYNRKYSIFYFSFDTGELIEQTISRNLPYDVRSYPVFYNSIFGWGIEPTATYEVIYSYSNAELKIEQYILYISFSKVQNAYEIEEYAYNPKTGKGEYVTRGYTIKYGNSNVEVTRENILNLDKNWEKLYIHEDKINNPPIFISHKIGHFCFACYDGNLNEITSKEFTLNDEQIKLISQYSKLVILEYYNATKKEFFHIFIFHNNRFCFGETLDKCLFFVFRTKIKNKE